MKYLLLTILACANFSCSKSQASSSAKPITIHCQVSPDAWKRYSVTVGSFLEPLSSLQTTNGTWKFKTNEGVVVYSTVCHTEIWFVGTTTTYSYVFVTIFMFNHNFSILLLVLGIYFLAKYQSGLKVGTYFCFKAHKLVYFDSRLPTKKYNKCFYTRRFTNAQQATIKEAFEKQPRGHSYNKLP